MLIDLAQYLVNSQYVFLVMKHYRLFAISLISALMIQSTTAYAGIQPEKTSRDNADGECVVLVHGLARTSHSMDEMELGVQAAGFSTVNLDYPSRSFGIPELARIVVEQGVENCREKQSRTIHFVTHSLGGILVRHYLVKNKLAELGRVVQLAPPNKGSVIAEMFRDEQWYRWLTGPAGQQLGTGADGIPGELGPVDYPTGVIAGNEHHPVDNWMAEILPGDSDGKVQVEHTRVEGMSDFIVLPHNHITIMNQQDVIRQTVNFLHNGNFNHSNY
jgi:hypothetical protein